MKLYGGSGGKHESQKESSKNIIDSIKSLLEQVKNIEFPQKFYNGNLQEDLKLLLQHISDGSEKAIEESRKISNKMTILVNKLQSQREHIKSISLKKPSSSQSNEKYESTSKNNKNIKLAIGSIAGIAAVASLLAYTITNNPTLNPFLKGDPVLTTPPPIVDVDTSINIDDSEFIGEDSELVMMGTSIPGATLTDSQGNKHEILPESKIFYDVSLNTYMVIDSTGENFYTGYISPSDYTSLGVIPYINNADYLYLARPSGLLNDYGIEPGTYLLGTAPKTAELADESIQLINPSSNTGQYYIEASEAYFACLGPISEIIENQANLEENQFVIINSKATINAFPNNNTYDDFEDISTHVGDVVQLVGSNYGNWLQVQYGDEIGFIKQSSVSSFYEPTISVNEIHARRSPSATGEHLIYLNNGTTVKVLDDHIDGNWSKILLNDGRIAYVDGSYITEIEQSNSIENQNPETQITYENDDFER